MTTFHIAEPKTATEARRLAASYSKALQMEADGYTVETEIDEDGTVLFYWVRRSNPEVKYYVVSKFAGCTCPDFKKHGQFCKHMIFVNIMEAKQEVLQFEEICAEHDKKMEDAELETTGTDPFAKF